MLQLQLVQELPGHAEPAWQVSFNPSRNLLASCSTDRTFRLYSYNLPSPSSGTSEADGEIGTKYPSASDPKPAFNLVSTIKTEHKRTIRSIAWAPSGRTLATGSFDSSVGVWEEVDPEDDDIETEAGNEGVFRAKSEEDDDDMASESGIQAGSSRSKEWECVTTLEGHESECKSVGFSHDGGLLASCSRDKSVWVWEGKSRQALPRDGADLTIVQPDSDFECIAVLMDHSQDVKSIAWHPKEEVSSVSM